MARKTTLKGSPLTLVGPELKAGDAAPNPSIRKNLVESIGVLDAAAGKVKLISVVPSLDTPVCELQTVRFNEEAGKLPGVAFITISCDLPMAQKRFCGAKSIDAEKFIVLSDYYDHGFGKAYGTLIEELRVESRALFVVDSAGKIVFAQYVPEIAGHPNYDAALAAAKAAK